MDRDTVQILDRDLEKPSYGGKEGLSITEYDLEHKLLDLALDLQRPASRAYSVGQRSAMTDYSESAVPPGFCAGSSQPSSPALQSQDLPPTTSHQPLVTRPPSRPSSSRFRRSVRRYLPSREAISEEDTPPQSEEETEDISEHNIPQGALKDYQIALIMDHRPTTKERAVSLDYEVAKLINRLWNIGVGSLSVYTTQGLQNRITRNVDNWSVFRTPANLDSISLKDTISNALENYVTTLEAALEILNSSDIKFKPLLVLVLIDADPISSPTETGDFLEPLIQRLDYIQTKLPTMDALVPQIRLQFAPLKDTLRGNDTLSRLGEALKGDELQRVVTVSTMPKDMEYSEFLEGCIMQQARDYNTPLERKLLITSASRFMLESSALRPARWGTTGPPSPEPQALAPPTNPDSSQLRGSIPGERVEDDSYQPPPQSSLQSDQIPCAGTQRNNQVTSSRRPTRRENVAQLNPYGYEDAETNGGPRHYATRGPVYDRTRAPRGPPDPIPRSDSSHPQPSSGGIVSDSLNALWAVASYFRPQS